MFAFGLLAWVEQSCERGLTPCIPTRRSWKTMALATIAPAMR